MIASLNKHMSDFLVISIKSILLGSKRCLLLIFKIFESIEAPSSILGLEGVN